MYQLVIYSEIQIMKPWSLMMYSVSAQSDTTSFFSSLSAEAVI